MFGYKLVIYIGIHYFSCSVVCLLCRFLSRIVDSLESLLRSGADKDPEIIEQV